MTTLQPLAYLKNMFGKDEIIEIRGMFKGYNNATKIAHGFFDNMEMMIDELTKVNDGRHEALRNGRSQAEYIGMYHTLNPISNTELLTSSYNKLQWAGKGSSTKDVDISCIRWLLIDADPERSTGASSSNEELAKANAAINEAVEYLEKEFHFEPYIVAMSGNGFHALYKLPDLDIKHAKTNHKILAELQEKCTIDGMSIDQTVFNPSRISKIYGTWARKGDQVQKLTRVHRLAEILGSPCNEVSLETYLSATKKYDKPEAKAEEPNKTILDSSMEKPEDSNMFLTRDPGTQIPTANKNIEHRSFSLENSLTEKHVLFKVIPGADHIKYILYNCPWQEQHTGGAQTSQLESAVIQHDSGLITYNCFHSHCKGRSWHDVKSALGIETQSSLPVTCYTCGEPICFDNANQRLNIDKSIHICNKNIAPEYVIDEAMEELNTYEKTKTPSFPINAFPLEIQALMECASENLGMPPDWACSTVLATVSAALGNNVRFSIEDEWKGFAPLWFANVGWPGLGKTPIMAQLIKPLDDLEDLSREQYQREMVQHSIAMLDYENDLSIYKSQKRSGKATQAPIEPSKPGEIKYQISDTTMECVVNILSDNPRGVLLVKDEILGWVKGFNQYKKGDGPEKQFWLECWNSGRYRVDRVSKPSQLLVNPYIPVIGGIQPAVLSQLKGADQDDGFFERFILVWPDLASFDKTKVEIARVDPDLKVFYARMLEALYQLHKTPEGQPWDIPVKGEALEIFYDFRREMRQHALNPDTPLGMRGIYSKMDMQALRLATCIEPMNNKKFEEELYNKNIQMSSEAMIEGIQCGRYALATASIAIEKGNSITDHDAVISKVYQFVQRKQGIKDKRYSQKIIDGIVTKGMLTKFKVCNTKEEAQNILSTMVNNCYAVWVDQPKSSIKINMNKKI